nr:MAG TPA: hypothetical protein [Caudoviricetes sp.]
MKRKTSIRWMLVDGVRAKDASLELKLKTGQVINIKK